MQEIIETKTGKYVEEILYLNTLAKNFRKERFKNGAINFSSTEVKFQLDESGKPLGIIVKESKGSSPAYRRIYVAGQPHCGRTCC